MTEQGNGQQPSAVSVAPAPNQESHQQIDNALSEDTIRAPIQQRRSAQPSHSSHSVQFLHAIASLLSMIVVALFILTFIAQPFRIPSASMEPSLLVGDFLLVNKMVDGGVNPGSRPNLRRALGYREVRHREIIVFRYPPDPGIHVVKRVIGIPGDRIHLHNGVVYLNGVPQQEPYTVAATGPPKSFRDQFPTGMYTDPEVDPKWSSQLRREIHSGEFTVPPNSYFVLGDNRGDSRDSRYWGLVPRQNIVGSPFVIYFSLRQESLEDVANLPDDKLDQQKDGAYSVMNFARWDRMFRVVR